MPDLDVLTNLYNHQLIFFLNEIGPTTTLLTATIYTEVVLTGSHPNRIPTCKSLAQFVLVDQHPVSLPHIRTLKPSTSNNGLGKHRVAEGGEKL